MRSIQDTFGWLSIDSAPLDEDVAFACDRRSERAPIVEAVHCSPACPKRKVTPSRGVDLLKMAASRGSPYR
jgi:hypothetical protein